MKYYEFLKKYEKQVGTFDEVKSTFYIDPDALYTLVEVEEDFVVIEAEGWAGQPKIAIPVQQFKITIPKGTEIKEKKVVLVTTPAKKTPEAKKTTATPAKKTPVAKKTTATTATKKTTATKAKKTPVAKKTTGTTAKKTSVAKKAK
ncbi:MAG: hypothetical protein ACI86H_002823 [bacterium]|jgi:hypothetical protein